MLPSRNDAPADRWDTRGQQEYDQYPVENRPTDIPAQVEQIAYRLWQEEGCPHGRHEDHWRQAEKEYHADKPIRGAILDDTKTGQVGQLLSPLQAVVHAKTGVVYPMAKVHLVVR